MKDQLFEKTITRMAQNFLLSQDLTLTCCRIKSLALRYWLTSTLCQDATVARASRRKEYYYY